MRTLKQLQKIAKKLKIRITKKNKYKRIYKTKKQLIKEIKMKNKKFKFGVKKRIRFSEDTKINEKSKEDKPKKQLSAKKSEIVKNRLKNPDLRQIESYKEETISNLIARSMYNYNIKDYNEFLVITDLLDVYKSSKIKNMNAYNSIYTKYYNKVPIHDKPKVTRVFEYVKPLIEKIIEIRNL